MFNKGKVLLATDFSKTAEKLTDCLIELKNLCIEEVLILQVLEDHIGSPEAAHFAKKADQQLLEKSRKKAEKIGLKASTAVEIGKPYKEIIKKAEEENCSLILIASHGGGIIKELLLGSTTRNVIRKTTIPVLIEKYEEIDKDDFRTASENKFERILLPIDFSIFNDKVLDMVKKMSNPSEEIILTTIIEKSDSLEELEKRKNKAEADLKDIHNELTAENINSRCNIEVRHGNPAENIIEVAEEKDAGLIIMSTKGRSNLKELLIGSTAEKVAENSPIPVLLVPADK
jgi:nucleotide-binding universal stress UspA family protein